MQCLEVWPRVALRLGLFQGESQLYCYDVAPQQPALSPGKPCSPPSSPSSLPPSLTVFPWCPSVTQCILENVLRGAALVPRRALAVMGCEVLRVLQLSDTAIVPVSYHVPRKVRGALGEGLGGPGGPGPPWPRTCVPPGCGVPRGPVPRHRRLRARLRPPCVVGWEQPAGRGHGLAGHSQTPSAPCMAPKSSCLLTQPQTPILPASNASLFPQVRKVSLHPAHRPYPSFTSCLVPPAEPSPDAAPPAATPPAETPVGDADPSVSAWAIRPSPHHAAAVGALSQSWQVRLPA